MATVLAGLPIGGAQSDGDAHYVNAITSKYTGDICIYTYGQFDTRMGVAATSFLAGVYMLRGAVDQVLGAVLDKCHNTNYVRNSDFWQGATGHDIQSANSTIAYDADIGKNTLRMVNAVSPSVGVFVEAREGETLFVRLRAKCLSANLAAGRHVQVNVYDFTTSAVLLFTRFVEMDPAVFGGEWATVTLPPFVAPARKLLLTLATASGVTAAETHISDVIVSDGYGATVPRREHINTVVGTATVNFNGHSSGASATTLTYSSNFWLSFGWAKKASGMPYAAQGAGNISLVVSNVVDGPRKLGVSSAVVNSDGSVTVGVFLAPGEAGPITTGQISARVTATITTDGGFPYSLL